MSLQHFCRKAVVKISPDRNIVDACRLMAEKNVGCVVAERDGKLSGILTDRDIALKVTGALRDPLTTKVCEVMTSDPVRISVNKDIRHLTSLIHAYNVRRIPIVDDSNTTLGIATVDELISLIGDEMSEIGKAIAEEFTEASG